MTLNQIEIIRASALAKISHMKAINNLARHGNLNSLDQESRERYLNNAGFNLFRADEEAKKEEPQQAIIDYRLEAAQFFQQAVAELDKIDDPNKVDRAMYLKEADFCLVCAAQEAQREHPREEVINLYREEAKYYQQAADALDKIDDPNSVERARFISNAGISLSLVAEEAQREQPRKELIDCFLEVTGCFKKAADALDNTNDPNRVERAHYLNKSGVSLSHATKEAGKENPDQTLINQKLLEAENWKKKAAALSYYSSCTIS
jgi:hypothetical protein